MRVSTGEHPRIGTSGIDRRDQPCTLRQRPHEDDSDQRRDRKVTEVEIRRSTRCEFGLDESLAAALILEDLSTAARGGLMPRSRAGR